MENIVNFFEKILNELYLAFSGIFGENAVPIFSGLGELPHYTAESYSENTAGSITDEVDIVARTIWGEARSEGFTGMAAVAGVIVNRVNNGHFGKGFIGVCQAPKQFSSWNKNDPNYQKLLAVGDYDLQFSSALKIASDAVTGKLYDYTYGAIYYYAVYMNPPPSWSIGMRTTVIIGQHRFLKE